MNWKNVKKRFHEVVTGACEEPGNAALLITELEKSIDGKIFLINILIDIENGILTLQQVCGAIDALGSEESEIEKSFFDTIKKNTGLKVTSFLRAVTTDRSQYVRVMPLKAFITYSLVNVGTSQEDVDDVKNYYFKEPFQRVDLSGIAWSGANETCWVTTLQELQIAISIDPQPATHLNEALGLGYTVSKINSVEFVAIIYPPDYKLETFKPTVFDGCAGLKRPIRFVSSPDDSWGYTENTSGNGKNMKERIHKKLDGLENGFTTFYLGECNGCSDNRPSVLEGAIKRIKL